MLKYAFRARVSFLAVCVGALIAAPSFASPVPAQVAGQGGAAVINAESLALNEKGVAALQAKNTKLAEELFDKALKADSHNITAVYNLSGMYLTHKKVAEAEKLLFTYINKGVQDAGLYGRYGDALFAGHKLNEATAAYEKSYQLNPSNAEVLSHLGVVYSLQRRFDDAEKIFLAAVKLSPKDTDILTGLSGVFLANRKYEEAVSAAKRSLQVRPTVNAYVTLGSAYEEMKDYKNSLIAFERAEQLGDSRPELKDKIEKIKKAAG